MTGARDLIDRLASLEGGRSEFLAPVLPGQPLRARTSSGLVRTWRVEPKDARGFVIVHPKDERTVVVIDVPRPAAVERYLELLPAVHMILLADEGDGTWRALPWNLDEAGKRFGVAPGTTPLWPVHLVEGARPLDVVIARKDGHALWFHAHARGALSPGKTPEQKLAETLQQAPLAREHLKKQARLGGGEVEDVVDAGSLWQVRLRTPAGDVHTLAVLKDDLTIASAGICLSGNDRDFDLASISGVLDGDRY